MLMLLMLAERTEHDTPPTLSCRKGFQNEVSAAGENGENGVHRYLARRCISGFGGARTLLASDWPDSFLPFAAVMMSPGLIRQKRWQIIRLRMRSPIRWQTPQIFQLIPPARHRLKRQTDPQKLFLAGCLMLEQLRCRSRSIRLRREPLERRER